MSMAWIYGSGYVFLSFFHTPFVLGWVLTGSVEYTLHSDLSGMWPHCRQFSWDRSHTSVTLFWWFFFFFSASSAFMFCHSVRLVPLMLPSWTDITHLCSPCVGAFHSGLPLPFPHSLCSCIYCVSIVYQVLFIIVNPKSFSFLVRLLGFLPKYR